MVVGNSVVENAGSTVVSETTKRLNPGMSSASAPPYDPMSEQVQALPQEGMGGRPLGRRQRSRVEQRGFI